MLKHHCFSSVSIGVSLAATVALQALALYMPDPRRSSYKVPDILKLPDRIAVDMKFRALDPESEWEVYPLIAPNFRASTTNDAEQTTTPPDAFTRGLGLESGSAVYWRSPMPGADRWLAIEYAGERAVALYTDLDSDGRLADREKVLPADTTTHFAVPRFLRKREGWTDHALEYFLDAKRTWAGDETPALSWSYLLALGEHSRRMPAWSPHDASIGAAADDPFVRSLDTGGKTVLHAQVSVKDQTQWSVVTVADGVADTLFFDIDADGKVSESETIAPEYHEARFVVPSFITEGQDGTRAPYRAFLYARGRGAPAWCPGAVWEGPIELGEKTYRLIFFDSDLNGTFSDTGRDCYVFFSEEGPIHILDEVWGFGSTRSLPVHTQQRPTQIEGVNLFDMGMLEILDKDPTSGRVVLTRDTEDWGSLRVSLAGEEDITLASGELSIWRPARRGIGFSLNLQAEDPHRIPAWTYAIGRARFKYRGRTHETWSTDASGGTFAITRDAIFPMELGKLTLHVRSKNLPGDEKVPTVERGAELELTREITGAQGEVYSCFQNETTEKRVCSSLRILTAAGKEVVATKLEYG